MGSKPSGISGSRAATLLGLNQWSTPFELWQRIMEEREPGFNSLQGYVMPDDPDNAAIRWGNAFEDACISLTEEKLGLQITHREKEFQQGPCNDGLTRFCGTSDKWKYVDLPLTCHVDGMIYEDGYESGNVFNHDKLYEGKTTSIFTFRNKWGEPGTDKIPQNYQIQVQHNMMLSGAKEAVVSVLVFPEMPDKWEEMGWRTESRGLLKEDVLRRYDEKNSVFTETLPCIWAGALAQMGYHHLYYIKADPELQQTMLEKYDEWWTKYVIGRTTPDPMNVDDIKRLCPEPVGTIVITDESLIDAYREMKSIKDETSKTGALGKRVEQLKTMFLDRARKLGAVEDDESKNKWIFRDAQGEKICSWGKDSRGRWILR
jgi:predicted phage-related endonuclease